MKIERKIIIALITSKKYLHAIKANWKQEYLQNDHIRLVASWCWDYFEKRNKAPKEDIETIFYNKLQHKQIDSDLAEIIESQLLPSLSQEYTRKKIKVDFLIDQTLKYFKERKIALLKNNLDVLVDKGDFEEAEENIKKFQIFDDATKENEIDIGDVEALRSLDLAFEESTECVIPYPGALGQFWNDKLVRGGFVSLMATEKRGKSFLLLDMMVRAYRHGFKVAFFQAGDMTQNQQLLRTAIYLAKKSNKEKFCGEQYYPQVDCIKNQLGTCNRILRASKFAVFDEGEIDAEYLRTKLTYEKLLERVEDNPRYKPCNDCDEFLVEREKLGSIWLAKSAMKSPLNASEAKYMFRKYLPKKGYIKISTHENDTLKVSTIDSILNRWEYMDNFKPDVILIDYADLLIAESSRLDFRHQQNSIWKRLRGLSQKRNALVVAPTQADGAAYKKDTLTLENYSEDKRKYAHVTAMFGLNQDVEGREKKLGIMRINSLVMREDSFHYSDQVHIVQRLQMGRPVLGSFF